MKPGPKPKAAKATKLRVVEPSEHDIVLGAIDLHRKVIDVATRVLFDAEKCFDELYEVAGACDVYMDEHVDPKVCDACSDESLSDAVGEAAQEVDELKSVILQRAYAALGKLLARGMMDLGMRAELLPASHEASIAKDQRADRKS